MPKIVDHDQYKKTLAEKAIDIFAEHGYSGLGMRRIAQELGVSKSALYHYFPSKEALFAACGELVTARGSRALLAETKVSGNALTKLLGYFEAQEDDLIKELYLLLDYLRGRSAVAIAADKNMQLASERYLTAVAAFVGDANAKPVLCLLYGLVLQRFLDGHTTGFSELEPWLREALADD